MTPRNRRFVFLLFIFVHVSGSHSYSQVAPEIEWKTFSTDHFQLIYDANHQDLAKVYAAEAERAYHFLAPLFNNETPKKTILVLDDSTDSANGYATPLPRPLVNVYPVLPGSMDFLSHYSIWSREMITHEYTHILNFEPTNGFWAPFRFIFGGIFRPNALLPRWYLEGLAVQNESTYTDFGRLRSPLYKAMIRSEILDNVWGQETMARANEVTIPTWPFGSRPYFYGALVWNDIVRRNTDKPIGRLNNRYSRRFPFMINGPAIDETGMDFKQTLKEVYRYQGQIGRQQIERLQIAQTTDNTHVFNKVEGHLQHSPRISPDYKSLIFINKHIENKDQVLLLTRDSSDSFEKADPQKLLSGLDSVSHASWFPDSKSIVFSAQDEFDRYYTFSDLYTYEIESKTKTQITKGLRAHDPSVSLDGKGVVFIQNLASATRLAVVNKNGQDFKIIYEPQLQVRLSHPEYLDDHSVMFSERELNGTEYLRIIDTKTQKLRTALKGYEPILNAHKTQNGVVFLSTRSGVSNLYLADKDLKSAQALTNTATHIFSGTIDTTMMQVLATRLNSTGGHLESYPFKPRKDNLPSADPTEGYDWKKQVEPTPYSVTATSEDYSAVSYLFPQYWLPVLFAGPYGTAVGASISGQDPLQKHSYSAEGSWDTTTQKPGYGFRYLNTQTRVLLGLNLFDQTVAVDSTEQNNTQITNREIWSNLSGSFFLPGLSSDWRGSLGWSYFSNQYEGQNANIQQGPTAGFRYTSLSQRGYEISPRGKTLAASYTHNLGDLGNTEYGRTNAEGSYYWTKWLPKHHVMKSEVRGTYSQENRSIYRGTTTAGGDYLSSSINQPFIVRGYPLAEFVGWSLMTTSFEYRFPIWYIYNGPGTLPFFSRRLHGAVFWDAISVQGAYYASDKSGLERAEFGTFFSGYGAELRYDFTLGYLAPLTVRVGYHHGEKARANGSGGLYVGFMSSL